MLIINLDPIIFIEIDINLKLNKNVDVAPFNLCHRNPSKLSKINGNEFLENIYI